MGDIVAVAHPELVGVGRAHPAAAVIEDAAGKDGRRALQSDLPVDGVGGEFFLHGLEQGYRVSSLDALGAAGPLLFRAV